MRTKLTLKARPGARLRELLELRRVDYADFAISTGMTQVEDPAQARVQGRANLRLYTHPTNQPKFPRAELVDRWADYFKLDPEVFYQAKKITR